ncbi:AAA family ATPase [Rhizobium mongolense]|uniref:AAA family ATPase n=1 Tax=Rhizobium mongolense TaxID=57676 RepID=UPI0034A50505
MAKDDALNEKLNELARSEADLRVQRLTAGQAKKLGLPVGGSSNPVYRFELETNGETYDAVAFTSILNGRGRPATRAEALGQAIATNGAELFKHNPFFLVFDFAGGRFIAVSAAKLFGAFAQEAARRDIPYSNSATFSLTPSFDHKTVAMYATVDGDDVWWCGDIAALTAEELRRGIEQVRSESKDADVQEIVRATTARIEAAPAPIAAISEASIRPAFLPLGDIPNGNGSIELDARTWRMIVTAIRSSPAVILVGPPGTGKTALLHKAIDYFAHQADEAGSRMKKPLWATPDESWTTRDLVGGDTILDGEIAFRPGWVPRSLEEDRWLILDEANRADMDRIFGGLLTWLSGGRVAIGTENGGGGAREVVLGWQPGASGKTESEEGTIIYAAGSDWRLLGTYNALDAQRVFRFGQALGRRFVRVPIPAVEAPAFEKILLESRSGLDAELRNRVAGLYAAHLAGEATLLGPAIFIAMCNYLQAVDGAPDTAAHGEHISPGIDLQEILTEAYVVHVGTWLAQLEASDIDALRQRSIDNGSLSEKDWVWIRSMLGSLA